jgi:hypothetical protein
MKFLNTNNRQSEESVWISNSDLMSGLMVIFLFISVAFVRQEAPATIGEENVSKNYLQGLLQLENQINIALEEEFTEEEKKKWKMEVLPDLNLSGLTHLTLCLKKVHQNYQMTLKKY